MLNTSKSTPDESNPSREDEALYLERVQALAPQIAAAGEQIERERRIPDE